MNIHKTALTLGATVGFWHLIWVLFVAVGFAQPLIDFISRVHFLESHSIVAPFNFMTAIALVVVTFCVGYIFGFIFATIWNKIHKQVVM